ncbi:MAG TPA: hypothetical protein IAC94_00400 [Candidatus Coprenecus avistercoris]|uniref:Leucine-rich repeat domain-containing protein n=1 Tax=Candidatus Coprenecus avistercoris TaxID=2840730 RepID=A0A9D1J5M3_9BACT|nr:hypothetical protein [Candidatus Coprenecus avistercoris]
MKKFTAYILILSALISGCSREETASLTGGTLELTVSAPYFDIETKSGEAEFTDDITAYLLTGTAQAADPVPQDYAAGSSYFFTLPSGGDNIVFTTVEAVPAAYTASMDFANGTIAVTAAEGQPVGRDLLFGWLPEYSAGQTQASIDLRRASSRLNVSLQAIYGVDTVSDLSSTIQSAEVSISGLYTSALLNYKDLSCQYSGEGSIAFPLPMDGNGMYSTRVMTLPGISSATSTLILSLTMQDGTVRSYSSQLPSVINPNYSYNMNLLLSWDNSTADFTLSDISMSTVEMDGIPDQSFDLLTFSENLLTFRQEGGYGRTVSVIESRLGTWTAEIPTEALEHFYFRSEPNGTEATVDSPVLTGEEGDGLYIQSLTNNTGNRLQYSIPFSVSDGDSTYTYYLDIIQSDGSTQSIEYTSDSYHYINVSGENLTYIKFNDSGEPDTLTNGYVNGHYEIGHYMVSGELITRLSMNDANFRSLSFSNCTTLEELTTYNCYGDISSLDLSFAEGLENLHIDFNDTDITTLDLSGNTNLKTINLDINTLSELTLPPGSGKLESLYLYNTNSLHALDASGHTGLRELSLSGTFKSLNFNGCSALTELNLQGSVCDSLSELNISGCTSLRKFYLYGEAPLDSLDFTGCEFIDNIEIMYNPTIASILIPDARDLSYLRIDGFSSLAELSLAGSSIDYLNLYNCDAIENLDLSQLDITRLNVYHCDALTGINLASNPSLRYFSSRGNNLLATMNLSGTTALDSLDISWCGTLSVLNLDGCTGLSYLNFEVSGTDNSGLPEVDGLTGLKTLHLNSARTSGLDLKAMTSLKDVQLRSCSSLGTVDCSGLTGLTHFYNSNSASSILLMGCTGLDSLSIEGGSRLTAIDLEGAGSIKYLRLYNIINSGFTDLNLTLPYLEELVIQNFSNLKSLQVAEGNMLKKVYLRDNGDLKFANTHLNAASTLEELQIVNCAHASDQNIPRDSLNLSGYNVLRLASITDCYNYIYGASFEGCSALTDLRLTNNTPLEHLNITGCTALNSIDLRHNQLDSEELKKMLESLPDRSGSSNLYSITGDLSLIQTEVDNAQAKGWFRTEENLPDLEFSFDLNYE